MPSSGVKQKLKELRGLTGEAPQNEQIVVTKELYQLELYTFGLYAIGLYR